MSPYPFTFDNVIVTKPGPSGQVENMSLNLQNVRGHIPSLQTSRLRTMWLEAHHDPNNIIATPCTYDGLSSRLVEESGFPMIFLSGFAVSSTHGLPDTGYIALEEMCQKIQETVRQVTIPIMVDGDTGYGSPMNVRRTVQAFAHAGAAGVMIEDQTWPKRCGHTRGKAVVSRGEAFARIKAAVDARNEGHDIFILARTDALILGWEEAIYRAREFKILGADAIFVEALPDRQSMVQAIKEIDMPMLANIIEGGMTENLSAKTLAELGFACVAYPWTLVAAKIKAINYALEGLKKSMLVGAPPKILEYNEMTKAVGFHEYWELEERYKYDEDGLVNEK